MPTHQRFLSLLPAVALACASCDWVSLATNALTYDEVRRGEAANVVASDSLFYATLAEDGLTIVDARSGQVLATMPPPAGSGSVDDLAIDGALLFVLDARPPGMLSVLSLTDPLHPTLVATPRRVPVGPFSGVSAAAGLCIVSGGTSELTAWTYDHTGALTGPAATADLGRGQPDALVAPSGDLAFISTHYWGPYFGLGVIRYDSAARRIHQLATLALDGAGFTTGGSHPANFPMDAALADADRLLLAHAHGVAVIDVRDPERPRLEGTIDVGGPAINVDVQGSQAAVAVSGRRPAVTILDLAAGPVREVRRHSLPPGTFPGGVALSAASVAVATRSQGILVFRR